MQKKGQVTVFVIIGVLTLFILLFIFFVKDAAFERFTRSPNVEAHLQTELDGITAEIQRCMHQETSKALQELGQGGGYFTPIHTLTFYGKPFTYLCTIINGKTPCVQQLLTRTSIETRLNQRLQTTIPTCMKLQGYKNKDYTLTTGTFAVSSAILPRAVLVNATYPLTLTKGPYEVRRTTYSLSVVAPLGLILDGVHDIINAEASDNYFDPLAYSFLKQSTYDLAKHISYPHRVYIVKVYGSDYTFQFAVEGVRAA